MNKKQRQEIAQWAVAVAQKNGADDAAVTVTKSRKIEIAIRDRKIEKLNESTQNSLDLTLYVNNRFSGHTTSKLDKTEMEKFIQEAVAMTKYLTEDPHRSLPDPKLYGGLEKKDLQINDTAYQSIDSRKRVELAKTIEDAALSESNKIISVTSGYYDTYTESVKIHSNGFAGDSESTFFSAGAEATVKDEDRGRPEDWCYATTHFFKDLPDIRLLGQEAVQRALRKIGQTKIKSGIYDMLVENRSMGRLLYYLYIPLRARSIQQKNSYLEDKLNQKIASENLTLIDDPFVPRGIGSRHFDDEGIAAKSRTIIEKGILKQYYIDNYYGKKLNMEPNSGSPSNIVFQPGNISIVEMTKNTKSGILITNFIGGNANPTTGDFSFGIIGQYIEDGKIVKPINEMNITGNMNTLWKQVQFVGNDPYIYSSLMTPSLYFTDVDFSGI